MVAYQFALLDITVRFCSPQPKGSEIMALINNMLSALLILFIFIILCIVLFIALALPIELVKEMIKLWKR